MEGVVGVTEPQDLAVDARTTLLGVLERFQNQGARTLGGHESVARAIKRTGRALDVVVARRQCLDGVERRDACLAQRGLGAGRQHDVGVALADGAHGRAHRVRGRGTGGDDRRVLTLHAKLHGHLRGRDVGDDHGREEWMQTAAVQVFGGHRGHHVEAADASSQLDPHPEGILLAHVQPGIVNRHPGGRHGQVGEARRALHDLAVHVVERVPVAHLAGELGRQPVG